MINVDYKSAYALPRTQCQKVLKKQISDAVDERCLYLKQYFCGDGDSGKKYDEPYMRFCEAMNLAPSAFSHMMQRELTFNFTINRIVPLSYYMMDTVFCTGRTSIQECWCGNTPEFDAPRAVDLFAYLYAQTKPKSRLDSTQYIRQHRRYTIAMPQYSEGMYDTVVYETFQARTKEIWEDHPFCRKNLNQAFVPTCYMLMFRDVTTGTRDVKDIHPLLRNQRVKKVLTFASMLAPVDYFLIPDYANYLLPYMIFHYPDGTPYKIADNNKLNLDTAKEIICQFASMTPEHQDVALQKLFLA